VKFGRGFLDMQGDRQTDKHTNKQTADRNILRTPTASEVIIKIYTDESCLSYTLVVVVYFHYYYRSIE